MGIKKSLELKQIKQMHLMTVSLKFITRYVKKMKKMTRLFFNNVFISLLKKIYERGAFSEKMVYKRVRGWTSGRSLPV